MNIGAIPNNTFPSIGYAISASQGGKMSLPVAPGLVIYSHFKHVSGTPAPEGTQGVNISKLKILNTMIEQLSKMKSQSSVDMGVIDESDEKRINALIDQYQKQIKAAQAVSMYTPTAPAAGTLFSISA
jgi:hypothetical protein